MLMNRRHITRTMIASPMLVIKARDEFSGMSEILYVYIPRDRTRKITNIRRFCVFMHCIW